MRPTPDRGRLTLIGLIVLGLVAVALSAAALLQNRTVRAVPATPTGATTASATSAAPSSAAPSTPSSEPSETAPATTAPPQPATVSVVVVGDSHSVGDPAQTWVGPVAEQLHWAPVVNLSAPGRGYLATPRSCEGSPCTPFGGTVAAIAAAHPEVVVTFGGVADGDFTITTAAAQYFKDLRAALPNAKLIAISPVTTDAQTPFWLGMHAQSIRDGVEAVGGVYIDVGQPGLGNGESLSAQAQAEIARQVVARLA